MAIDHALPGWPPVLHEAWAAAYLSLSATTFRAAVVPEVAPVRLTPGRIGWLRRDLDLWLARRAGTVAPSDAINPWDAA
jgi:predicted DNA-binding transcriptional regulator AlpA